MFTPEQLARFSELDSHLYHYITTNSEKVIYMRIRELAEIAHVSPTSILRFCKKVDCDGFSEFKTKLKIHLNQSESKSINDPYETMTEFLERTLKTDYQEKVTEIAECIANSDHVVFLGTGSSGILAEYASRYFSSLKKFSLAINDPYFPITGNFMKNSTVIVLSVSGETPSIISKINKFREEGANIVTITNSKACTAVKLSDHYLSYYVNRELIKDADITTQLPVIYLIETLAKDTYKTLQQTNNDLPSE
ncbi:MurR/RpiR family transcriptional regulator [Bacillus shivajii]|uniref:MurR/RpiR family transcriptional regulator n=1 Tax=Bacillus shivajii TaxID=1983719 RepID=UPI001CF9B7EF|nr:MurR/RpiR family transcriptional regulator [Bacillus shivajii]UCZ55226.1 MurR/RpiR family transcriptional regulator [Bacillus shivajii]